MLLNPFTYHRPRNLYEATELLSSNPEAKILAGGTFALNQLKVLKKRDLKTPAHVIGLQRIKELKGIHLDPHSIVINAMTTLAEIANSQELKTRCPVLGITASNIATTQLRNMATIGGNITSRYVWTEFNNCLLALDAKLRFILADKKTITMTMEEFLTKNAKAPGLLVSITVDTKKDTHAIYKRVAKTPGVDLPLFTFCLKAEISNHSLKDVRAVLYQGTSLPKREKKIEHALEGLTLGSNAENDLPKHTWPVDCTHLSDEKKMILQALVENTVSALFKEVA